MHKLVHIRRIVNLERKAAKQQSPNGVMVADINDVNLEAQVPNVSQEDKRAADGMVGVDKKDNKTSTGGSTSGNVCRIEDSPFRIMKVAASGNMKEFERLYLADKSRIKLRDSKGQTVFHHAASKGKAKIMDYILKEEGDINATDKKGNTPLHIAVEKKSQAGVEFLCKRLARSDVLNNNKMAPLHVAVETGCDKLVAILLTNGSVDIVGEFGQTPLHYAANKGQTECAKVLLQNGASLETPCHVGYYPVHVAAKEAACGVLDAIFVTAQKRGCLFSVIAALDKDKNSPLHSAVNSGNSEAVRVCLKHGATIDTKQNDHATPLHLACAQGNQTMIRFMLEMRPEARYQVIFLKDAMDMTPLHTAAMFDHHDIVTYLIEQGADIDSQDREGRTPLLVAASNQAWESVRVLLAKGANMSINDNKGRNFLHLSILHGARLKMLALEEDTFKDGQELLNQMDDLGCTPLHYATREGNLSSIEHLIGLGALMNVKNKDKQSPLHFAARYGRLNTCVRLLDSKQGAHIINETDGEGLTALHIASQNGHTKIVQFLLQKGSGLMRDHKGNTPLHLAAANGFNQTMKILLGVHGHILNAANDTGETALHLASSRGHFRTVTLLMGMSAEFTYNDDGKSFFDHAIENRHKDVASHIIENERWREALDLRSQEYDVPMIALIQYLPEVCLSVLDRCHSTSEHDEKSRDFYYRYDFRYLQNSSEMEEQKKENGETVLPMLALNVMVQFNRVELLSHPVCVNFLNMKWRGYGFWIHMANIGIYAIFLSLLTTRICTMSPADIVADDEKYSNFPLNDTARSSVEPPTNAVWDHRRVGMLVISVFCILNMFKEFVQIYQQRMKYFIDATNLLEWALYVTSSLFIIPDLIDVPFSGKWQLGSVAVFLAWFNLLLYLQRFDLWGIYVVMFMEILKTLVQVLIVFSILIIAFGLSFYILQAGELRQIHRTPLLSFMRTFVMMLGEIDYIQTYVEPLDDDNENSMKFGTITYIFLVAFILLMPILLMNLLIGLAVGDIEAVQRNARLKRLAMQVELHTDLETKIPPRILKYVDKTTYKVYPRGSNKFLSKLVGSLFKHIIRADINKHGDVQSVQQTLILDELFKQKRRIKEVTESMEKQHELLKLIVQKMEIHSEAENQDEGGITTTPSAGETPGSRPGAGWATPNLRRNLVRQASVVAKWSKESPSGQSSPRPQD